MKITEECSWLTLVWFFLAIMLGTLYFTAQADNSYLEQRYHQCSGRYY